MSIAVTSIKPGTVCRIGIRSGFGWRRFAKAGLDLWVKGYGHVEDGEALLGGLMKLAANPKVADVAALLAGLDGHFAVAASGSGWAFAGVDYVRSIPLAFARCGDEWCIDDQALRLRDRAGLGQGDIDPNAALAVGMAGYTVDVATLYRGLEQVGPGELVLFAGSDPPRRHRYYCYRPWRADKPAYDSSRARKALAETTLALIDGMMKGIGDRILAVPLSAGRDSRLIVSAAHHLGYRNIRTFTYGHPGNHEAEASRVIAERLGLPWRFEPTSVASMRHYFAGGDHASYCSFADTLQSVPFVQDLMPIAALKADGYIPADAVMCNGNSGDYISGAHIVPAMRKVPVSLSDEERLLKITDALIAKHFALWRALVTPGNCEWIASALRASIARAGAELGDPTDDYGIYEYAEFQDRQCRYVITGQRIYEFLGHEWRLPLWAKSYLDFWEGIPLSGKAEQNLYADMLTKHNWGGVWSGIPVNAKTVKPDWIRPIRFAAKLLHAPLGRDRWHRFEKQYFNYWMSGTGASAIVDYLHAALDRRGARNEVSWIADDYLAQHLLRAGTAPP